jgi:DNA-binding NarL/FixJ family response regulator
MKDPKRLVIADDHALMLEGLSRLLANDFEIVGTAKNGRALLAEAERLRPDVVVLDVGMPELNGIEAARQLCELLPEAKIIFITQQLDPAYIHAAFTAGAMSYVAKQSASTELVKAIEMALKGQYYVTPLAGAEIARSVGRQPEKNPAELFGGELTPRQREVLQLVAEGKSSKQIAVLLNISAKTVGFHRNCLMDELGLRTTAELTRYAMARGIIS